MYSHSQTGKNTHRSLHDSYQVKGILCFLDSLHDDGENLPLPLYERVRVRGIF